MFVYTLNRKRAFRIGLIALAGVSAVAVGVAAIFTAINANAAEKKLPIYSVERGDNKIALSFDVAGGNSNTDELIKLLGDNGVKATFFVTGEFADKYPDDVRKLYDGGHEIANHSDAHQHLKGMNLNAFIADTKNAETKLRLITGQKPALYRAPYGEFDENILTTLEGMGYLPIQYSVDSTDAKETKASAIVKKVLDKATSGSILLFHNDLANTAEALPDIINQLKKKGYSFVTVGDLVYSTDYHVDSSGKQIYDVTVGGSEPTFSANRQVNGAFAAVRANLSDGEIASIRNGITGDVAVKLSKVLSSEQIAALKGLSAKEYTEAWSALASTAEGVLQVDADVETEREIDDDGVVDEEDDVDVPEIPGNYAEFEGVDIEDDGNDLDNLPEAGRTNTEIFGNK
ncbi:MAG: polysaccharide deacetylase family protein [Oscillospiraceae bacterium]|jgi:peptidoglycan/xylan/chitin deacetylase (PgdA/CDA1 family)|nr:polysaccharide deacetylase family protein [Oscillospiraceae bacterium]